MTTILLMGVIGKTFASIATTMSTADYWTMKQVEVCRLEMMREAVLPIDRLQVLKVC